jgi:hypothetical protein
VLIILWSAVIIYGNLVGGKKGEADFFPHSKNYIFLAWKKQFFSIIEVR